MHGSHFVLGVLDFLEALDIDPDVEDQGKRGLRQIKMFEDEDCQGLKTLIDNHTISPEAQWTPSLAAQAIQSIIKEDVHFWHHRDELLSDLCQLPNKGIHALSTCIITLIGKCKFPSHEVKEMMKLMILQHAVKYHEALEWICLQGQDTLTYQSLLIYCTQLEARCKQYQQAEVQGRAQLTTNTAASAIPIFFTCKHAVSNHQCKLHNMWIHTSSCTLPCIQQRML